MKRDGFQLRRAENAKKKMIARIILGAGALLATLGTTSPFLSEAALATSSGPNHANTRRQDSNHPSPARAGSAQPTLADLAWLSGRWQGVWGPRVAEQVWMPPKSGLMEGMFRLMEGDKTIVIELLIVSESPNGIELRIRHFTPSSIAWEASGPALLDLASSDPKNVVFENREGGDPKKSIFERVDADTYISRAEILSENSDAAVTEITYRRVKTPENPSAGNAGRR